MASQGIRAVLALEVEAIRATAYAANLQRSDPARRGSTGEPDEELTSTPASITPSRRLPRSAVARVQAEDRPAGQRFGPMQRENRRLSMVDCHPPLVTYSAVRHKSIGGRRNRLYATQAGKAFDKSPRSRRGMRCCHDQA